MNQLNQVILEFSFYFKKIGIQATYLDLGRKTLFFKERRNIREGNASSFVADRTSISCLLIVYKFVQTIEITSIEEI